MHKETCPKNVCQSVKGILQSCVGDGEQQLNHLWLQIFQCFIILFLTVFSLNYTNNLNIIAYVI